VWSISIIPAHDPSKIPWPTGWENLLFCLRAAGSTCNSYNAHALITHTNWKTLSVKLPALRNIYLWPRRQVGNHDYEFSTASNALQYSGETRYCVSVQWWNCAAFQWFVSLILYAKKGGCIEREKDTWLSPDQHNKYKAGKDGQFTPSDRCGFMTCEKLTYWFRTKNIICETMWLLLKSPHLVHPITVVHPW